MVRNKNKFLLILLLSGFCLTQAAVSEPTISSDLTLDQLRGTEIYESLYRYRFWLNISLAHCKEGNKELFKLRVSEPTKENIKKVVDIFQRYLYYNLRLKEWPHSSKPYQLYPRIFSPELINRSNSEIKNLLKNIDWYSYKYEYKICRRATTEERELLAKSKSELDKYRSEGFLEYFQKKDDTAKKND